MTTIDTTKTLHVWRDNRIDAEEWLQLPALVEGFFASEWADTDMPMERCLRLYLAHDERVAWEPEDDTFWDLLDLIRDRKFAR